MVHHSLAKIDNVLDSDVKIKEVITVAFRLL
jgi:hypothetical protein